MPFDIGDMVQARNDPTLVGIVRAFGPKHAGEQYFSVFWNAARGTTNVAESALVRHVERVSPTDDLRAGNFAGFEEFQRIITLQRLLRDSPLRNNIYAFNASRTQFYPYQFKPLLKLLESRKNRLLICDEVGLGKTIEAGLILLELLARQTMHANLVVCPSALTGKWRDELLQRFGQEFRVLRAPDLYEYFDDYEETPGSRPLKGIVSIETLRGAGVSARLEELRIPFDFVVVDEAHSARNFNRQRAVLKMLAETAGTLLFLTATPIHLGQRDLFSLLNLLDEDDFPDAESAEKRFNDNQLVVRAQAALSASNIDLTATNEWLLEFGRSPWMTKDALLRSVIARVVDLQESRQPLDAGARVALSRDLAELNLLGHILTRTRKRDVQELVGVRRAQAEMIDFSPREEELYHAVSALIRAENKGRAQTAGQLAWRLHTPQRRMSSSIQAMVEFFRDESPLMLGDGDDDDSFATESGATDPEEGDQTQVTSEGALKRRIRQLLASWPADGADAKYERLRDLLKQRRLDQPGAKTLLFATFKHTLRYLQRRLTADGIRAELISGDVDPADRRTIIARFRDLPETEVLLSSRVGSEGLDFQFCQALINYDLPWNPMEVEQRIGRIDRIGQQAKAILISNFWTRGTIEERILMRLYDRIGIFERSIGELEMILGEIGAREWSALLAPDLSDAEQTAQAQRLELLLEQKRHQVLQLEASAAQFIGVDSFFEEEIAAIRRNRRYVTGAQLLHFTRDFLRRECPRARLEYDESTGEGVLTPDGALRNHIQQAGHTAEAPEIVTGVGRPIPITFDAQVAFRKPRTEFLSVMHGMIRTVADWAEKTRGQSAYLVSTNTKLVPPGAYFFVVYRTTVHAARSFNSLDTVILTEQLHEACSADVAEAALGEVVENGWTERSGELTVPPDLLALVPSRAESAFLARLGRLRELESQSNAEFVDQRIASLEQHHKKNRSKLDALLVRAVAGAKQERYLRMLRGQIANLDANLQTKRDELEQLRQVRTEHVEVAAGILEVVAS